MAFVQLHGNGTSPPGFEIIVEECSTTSHRGGLAVESHLLELHSGHRPVSIKDIGRHADYAGHNITSPWEFSLKYAEIACTIPDLRPPWDPILVQSSPAISHSIITLSKDHVPSSSSNENHIIVIVNGVSRSRASSCGKKLVEGDDPEALKVAQEWRRQHAEPTALCFRQILDCVDGMDGCVVTYRLKRMSSILKKLRRKGSDFKLGAMDDIGGCRVIVKDMDQLEKVQKVIMDYFDVKTVKDYVQSPQKSGYRSVHVIVKMGKANYRVEIQIRTKLQHCWATAVESAGTIYRHEYKSPQVRKDAAGDDADRIRFFALASNMFALEEDAAQVPDCEGTLEETILKLRELDCCESILQDLKASTEGVFLPPITTVQTGNGKLYLLLFSTSQQFLEVRPLLGMSPDEAMKEYNAREAEAAKKDENEDGQFDEVVLVHAQNPEQLRVAYPNYSSNVNEFGGRVTQLVGLSW